MNNRNAFRHGLHVAVAIVIGIWALTGRAVDGKDTVNTEPAKTTEGKSVARDSSILTADTLRATRQIEHHVVAYYFHGNVRCASCLKIEAYTKEAIDSAFGETLRSGLLEWRLVNTDSSQNEHFLEDYQLYTRSVVLSDVHKGRETRWKNLDKVWDLLGDQAKFRTYIQDEVRLFLDSTK